MLKFKNPNGNVKKEKLRTQTSVKVVIFIMVSKAAEVLRKAHDLKEIASNIKEITSDSWPAQQQLQKIYHDVLLLDLEYALDQKVEQDLWNYCFKNYIVTLQTQSKGKKSNSLVFQNRLLWFLDCASGFYLSLLQEICSIFNLDLAFLRSDNVFGFKRPLNETAVNKPNIASCHYICQHCLVHLGDVARYRNQLVQAESFYRHAVSLGANSGHPYNQLALLEATRGDILSTVFYYTRSIALTHKFPAAVTNLANTLQKCLNAEKPVENSKMTVSEYESSFLQLHAILYLSQDANLASKVLQSLNHSLTPLIATQEFSSWKLIQMSSITIFMYNQLGGKSGEINSLLSEYIVGFINSLLVPLYTTSSESILDYFGLPAVKVFLSWIKCEPEVLNVINRQHIWRGFCTLFNLLPTSQAAIINFTNAALPEDYDLQGFLPLENMFTTLNFGGDKLNDDVAKRLRAYRILKYGEWLAGCNLKPICINDSGKYEASQSEMPKIEPKAPQPSAHQDVWKSRRQNVALQSLLQKQQFQSEPDIQTTPEMKNVEWWPQSNLGNDLSTWGLQPTEPVSTNRDGMYSLFSGTDTQVNPLANNNLRPSNIGISHQSFWSGPGPSPLERLLEQQKQFKNSKPDS